MVFPGQAPHAAGLCGRRAGGPGVGGVAAQVRCGGVGQASGAIGARRALGGRARGLGWLLAAARLVNSRVSEPVATGLGLWALL